MAPERTCPFCNSAVTVGAATCPRCGERLGPAVIPAASGPFGREPDPPVSKKSTGRNTPVLIIGGVMLVGAVTTLIATQLGDDRPTGNRSGRPVNLIEARRPAEWQGLGYLPAATNAVVGLKPRLILESGSGEALLGERPRAMASIERSLGLRPGGIEEAVIGLQIGSDLTPGWVAVLTAARRFETDLISDLGETFQLGDKEFIRYRPKQGELDLIIWTPQPRMLVLTDRAERVADLPLDPTRAGGRLKSGLWDLINGKLIGTPVAWAAADCEGWHQWAAPRFLVSETFPLVDVEGLTHLDGVVISLGPKGQAVELLTWFLLDDDEVAADLHDHIMRRLGDFVVDINGREVAVNVTGQPDDIGHVLKRFTKP